MLAALSTRTLAFSFPFVARTSHWKAGRATSTRVSRLLAVEAGVESRPAAGVAKEIASSDVSVKSSFLQTLVERGFYHQCTDLEGLDNKLSSGDVITAYLGFDATADRCVLLVVLILYYSRGPDVRPQCAKLFWPALDLGRY